MAGRFNNPYPQFLDSTPEAYSGGTLSFYASGTSTLQSVYSDEALSTPITNPVTLNAAGRATTDIFLQDLEYKVVLKDSSGTTIWTADPVSARDSSLIAKTLTGSGSPNGTVAGTAGSSTILPDFYWDYTNRVLYVCTTTGTSSTAVWTAINASSATASVPPPQGRLTLTSNAPVLSSGVSAGTAVYYTPFIGNQAPIYNGSTMVPTEFAELTLTLSSSHAANSIYDIFVFNNSGVVTLATGPAWSSATAGSGSRGTGAGTTELTRVKGLWVNAVSMTARNGSTTYTVGANLGTYLGSIFMDGSNGQVTCHTAFGQSRKWGVWNAYNRVPTTLLAGDSTASWNYTTNTIRASNNTSANSLTTLIGLPEEAVDLSFVQSVIGGSTSLTSQIIANFEIGIGVNSSSTFSGKKGFGGIRSTGGTSSIDVVLQCDLTASHLALPTIGTNAYSCNERTTQVNGAPTVNYQGTSASMLLKAVFRA
jgi:hypothetical protein